VNILFITHQQTKESEKLGKFGDNALFAVIKTIKNLSKLNVDFKTFSTRTSDNEHQSLKQRNLVKSLYSNSDLIIIFGDQAFKDLKGWFPLDKFLKFPEAFYCINEPAQILLNIVPKIEEFHEKEGGIYGFEKSNKTFGL
jgi:hypothetical protein